MGKRLGAAAAPLQPFLPRSHTSVTRSHWTQLQQHLSLRSAACPCQTDPSTRPRGQGTRLGLHCVAFARTRGWAGGLGATLVRTLLPSGQTHRQEGRGIKTQ